MIGVDTNVLVRLFVTDTPHQHAAAVNFFRERSPVDPAHISVVTAVEFYWVLTRRYKLEPGVVRNYLRDILFMSDAVVESAEDVRTALEWASVGDADLADALIAHSALKAGCSKVVTFDKEAADALAPMELLT